MTFHKPSTDSTSIGAFTYKGLISSTAMDYIDNSFTNILDKTGDTITGPITIGTGGNISIASGQSITGLSGGALTMNSGSTTTINGAFNVSGVSTITGAISITGAVFTANGISQFNGATAFASNCKISGAFLVPPVTTSAASYVATSTDCVIVAATNSSTVAVTLPTAALGRELILLRIGTNNAFLNPAGTELLNGVNAGKTISTTFNALRAYCYDGTNWFVTPWTAA